MRRNLEADFLQQYGTGLGSSLELTGHVCEKATAPAAVVPSEATFIILLISYLYYESAGMSEPTQRIPL